MSLKENDQYIEVKREQLEEIIEELLQFMSKDHVINYLDSLCLRLENERNDKEKDKRGVYNL